VTKFSNVRLTGITVNMKSGEIHINAVVGFTDENLAKSQVLIPYLNAEIGGVALTIEPNQRSLSDAHRTDTEETGNKD
jgi:hypothetical protein